MKLILKRRMPDTYAYQSIKKDLDVRGTHYNATWEEIEAMVTQEINARIKPLEEESREMMAQYARANAAMEGERLNQGGGRGGSPYAGGSGSPYREKKALSKTCHEWDEKKTCRFTKYCRFLHNGGGQRRLEERRSAAGEGSGRKDNRSRSRSPARDGRRSGISFEKKVKPTQRERSIRHMR
jgi:hypothetical protein